jgi:hypothetical protein
VTTPAAPARPGPRPAPGPGPARRPRRRPVLRVPPSRWLVYFLGVNAAILSADALVAYALGPPPGQQPGGLGDVASVIPTDTLLLPRELLAVLWALEVDGMGFAGLLGIRRDRVDWRAWLLFGIGAGASIGFQVFHLWPLFGRAVAPVAVVMAALVLEVPTKRARQAGPVPGAGPGTAGDGQGPGRDAGSVPAGVPARPRPSLRPDQAALARRLHNRGLSGRQVVAGMRAQGKGAQKDTVYAYLANLPPPPTTATAGNGGRAGGPEAPGPAGREPDGGEG